MNNSILFNKLKNLLNNSLANFSNYKVACIIESNGHDYIGVNIEPDVLNLGICAERNAIFSAITQIGSDFKIDKISILTTTKNGFGTPCGGCRQVIGQFSNSNTKVCCFNMDGDYKEFTISQLLPEMWSKKDLLS